MVLIHDFNLLTQVNSVGVLNPVKRRRTYGPIRV